MSAPATRENAAGREGSLGWAGPQPEISFLSAWGHQWGPWVSSGASGSSGRVGPAVEPVGQLWGQWVRRVRPAVEPVGQQWGQWVSRACRAMLTPLLVCASPQEWGLPCFARMSVPGVPE